jgi:uncharacterized repeat protein (TIGR01451 family)
MEHSYAVDFNQSSEEVEIELSQQDKLENSQSDNDLLEVDSNDNEVLGNTHTLNGGTFKDIKTAIKNAEDGDTISLSGTFKASSDVRIIEINKKLTITSSSQATLDGGKISSIFYLNIGAKGSVISNLKFINGVSDRGAAILIWADDVKVKNCVFEDNYVDNAGGAIASRYTTENGVNALIENCRFTHNGAKVAGGGVALFGDNTQVVDCIFDSNYASNDEGIGVYGGAIQLSMDNAGTAKVKNTLFINNWAKSNAPYNSHGGAGCIRDGVSYFKCTFIGNSADNGGALTYHASGKIIDCIFINNTATKFGGALSTGFLYNSMNLDISNCIFENNSAPIGGAAQLVGENIFLKDSNFTSNYASQNGGAINLNATTVVLTNNIYENNTADIDGGAGYISGKNVLIQDSVFVSNRAVPDHDKIDDGLGGAVYVESETATIENNEFKFNTARNGSAIYYGSIGVDLNVMNNVMYQNQAWVYALPISAEDIFFKDSENISVVIHGGNNIARYGNLSVSNAIHNDASYSHINVDGFYPLDGATDTGELYQDDREYNIDILLTVEHEDGSVVYNNTLKSSYLGEIDVVLDDLKPGKYYVNAKHFEDTYYKGITNVTSFRVYPKVDNQINISSDKEVYDFEDVVTWTVNVTNNGPSNSTEVLINNPLPEGLIYVSDTSDGLYDPKTGILNVSTLDVGEKLSFNILTVVNKTGEILNKANVTAKEVDSNLTNNYDDQLIRVNPAADIAVEKSVNNSNPNYKDLVNWTITVINNGPDIAHNITLHDIIPDTLTLVDSTGNYNTKDGIWKIESLGVGDKRVFNIITRVDSTGLIENNASAYADEFDYDLFNNEDNEIIKVNPACDLSVVKSVNATPVNYMDTVKWTLVISNNGPDNATGVKITDSLPEGFIYINSTFDYVDDVFDIGNLAVGEVITIDIICNVDTTGNYTNFAEITGNEYDPNLTNNQDNESITVNPACDLEITKDVDEPEPKNGELITWTIVVKNNGPDVAHDIKVYDVLPESLIWVEDDSLGDYDHLTGLWHIDELDIDEETSLEIICRVNKTGIIVNDVNVTSHEFDYDLSNNQDNESVEVEPSADVDIVKVVNNTNPNYNDLIKWTIIVSNNGPDKATGVQVDEKLPDGLIFINYTASKGIYDKDMWAVCCLEKDDLETLEIICRVNKTGKLTNNVTVKSNEYDPNLTNNEVNESIDVPPAVDIEVIHEVTNSTPLFGDTIIWKITIKNNGPDNASDVELTDILPESLIFVDYNSSKGEYNDGIWDIGKLDVGDVEYLNITCITNELGTTVNDAFATSFEYDWNESNNYDDAKINVLPVADLAIEKSVDKSNPNYGDLITWTLKVSNNGPNDASNVNVLDILPESLEFVKSSDDENYNDGNWHIGELKSGQIKKLDIRCRVIATGTIKNSASVKSDEYDPDLNNNHADERVTVSPASDLSITKIASKYKFFVGDVIDYVIEVVNNGPDTARNIKVNEILDDLLKLKSFKVTRGKFNKFTNVWTIDSLGYGESAKLYIRAIAMGSGILKNTVNVTSDSFDYDLSNNHDFAVVKVDNKPSIKKISSPEKNFTKKPPVGLEIHPTANPILMLVISSVFSILFFGGNISKKR